MANSRTVLKKGTLTVPPGCRVSTNFHLPALSTSLAQTTPEVAPKTHWQEVPHVDELEREILKEPPLKDSGHRVSQPTRTDASTLVEHSWMRTYVGQTNIECDNRIALVLTIANTLYMIRKLCVKLYLWKKNNYATRAVTEEQMN